jgi:Ala-tRNA(Pro) deacylase
VFQNRSDRDCLSLPEHRKRFEADFLKHGGAAMPVKRLKEFLDSHQVKYVSITHSPAFTAQEIAASAHIPGKELAKAVMIKIDGRMAMAVLPASYKIDFDLLEETLRAQRIELATEQEFKSLFPECEIGAMPPFGKLYGLETYVADTLAEDEWIAFNAGSHTELIKMSYEDFMRLAEPTVVEIAARAEGGKEWFR